MAGAVVSRHEDSSRPEEPAAAPQHKQMAAARWESQTAAEAARDGVVPAVAASR